MFSRVDHTLGGLTKGSYGCKKRKQFLCDMR